LRTDLAIARSRDSMHVHDTIRAAGSARRQDVISRSAGWVSQRSWLVRRLMLKCRVEVSGGAAPASRSAPGLAPLQPVHRDGSTWIVIERRPRRTCARWRSDPDEVVLVSPKTLPFLSATPTTRSGAVDVDRLAQRLIGRRRRPPGRCRSRPRAPRRRPLIRWRPASSCARTMRGTFS